MIDSDTLHHTHWIHALHDLADESVDAVMTDARTTPPGDGLAALYAVCQKARGNVIFFWHAWNVPHPPMGWYEIARHVWDKPTSKAATQYDLVIVWAREPSRSTSRVWKSPVPEHSRQSQKPVVLLRQFVTLYTKESDVVLDPIAGTGAIVSACKQAGRRYIGFEARKEQYDIACMRLRGTGTPALQDYEDPAEQKT